MRERQKRPVGHSGVSLYPTLCSVCQGRDTKKWVGSEASVARPIRDDLLFPLVCSLTSKIHIREEKKKHSQAFLFFSPSFVLSLFLCPLSVWHKCLLTSIMENYQPTFSSVSSGVRGHVCCASQSNQWQIGPDISPSNGRMKGDGSLSVISHVER